MSSNVEAPCERIAKWLVGEFNQLEPPNSLSVQNSVEFVNRLKNVEVRRNEQMGSYDLSSLLLSIPVKKCMVLVRKWLVSLKIAAPYVDMYVDLTQLCTRTSSSSEAGFINNAMVHPWVIPYPYL